MGFDWDLLLKALGFLIAAVAAYFQVRNLNFAARASLKTDLEILKLIDASDPNYQVVKTEVDRRVASLYAPEPPKTRANVGRLALIIVGSLWAFGFAYWTVILVTPTFSWWAVLTGYIALAGLGWIVLGVSGTDIIPKLKNRL